MSDAVYRATYELEPAGSGSALAQEASLGQPDGPGFVQGRVVEDGGGRAVVEFPADNWSDDLSMIVASMMGEIIETREFTRCRLVGLDVPAGRLVGPAFSADDGVAVGAIVKPSLGLRPFEVAEVVAELAAGGATMVKDDELLGDPPWCPLRERVAAVAAVLPGGVTYCPNITGSAEGIVDRARGVIDLGATGIMIDHIAQGFDSLRVLRAADLGVPILAHRVASGGWTRNERFGVSLEVVASLTRLAGADFVLVGAFDGKLHDTNDDVDAQIDACWRSMPGAPNRSTAVIGGGVGPDNAASLTARAGAGPTLALLGQAAYRHPDGVAAGVRATVESLR